MATRGALFAARFGRATTASHRSALTFGELAAVVAATGIVVAIGYLGYETHRVKKEVAEGVAAATELIPAVTEFFRRHGEVPSERALTYPPGFASSTLVESVTVVDGRIDVLFGPLAAPAIAGRQISLTPYETVDRHVVWLCGNRKPSPGLEPLGFTSGGRSATPLSTTIERRYLSQSCR